MNIGNAIKQLRKEKKISQIELARKCKITQTALSQIESGITIPNSGTLKKIAAYLGIPATVIYLLATEEGDVAKSKKKIYKELFPMVRKLILKIVE